MSTSMLACNNLISFVVVSLPFVSGCGGSVKPQSFGAVESYTIIDSDWSLRSSVTAKHIEEATVASGDSSPLHEVKLKRIRNLALETFPTGEWTNFGPDSSFREIALNCQRGRIVLRSWHPLFELNPNLVAGSNGVTTLEGQTRDQFLAADDPDYVRQREAFDSIEEMLRSLATENESKHP